MFIHVIRFRIASRPFPHPMYIPKIIWWFYYLLSIKSILLRCILYWREKNISKLKHSIYYIKIAFTKYGTTLKFTANSTFIAKNANHSGNFGLVFRLESWKQTIIKPILRDSVWLKMHTRYAYAFYYSSIECFIGIDEIVGIAFVLLGALFYTHKNSFHRKWRYKMAQIAYRFAHHRFDCKFCESFLHGEC